MKKLLLMMSVLLSLGMFCACSSDDEIIDVTKGQSLTENNENEKELLEVWELKVFDKGWGNVFTFNPFEVVCNVYENDLIEVKNETDVDLSPFVNSGVYHFELYSKDFTVIDRTVTKDIISIDGIEYEYIIDKDSVLHIYHNYSADGQRYDFVKTKKN